MIAYCLEAHDLVLAKCAAGRESDWEFAREALRHGLVDPNELRRRAADLPLPPGHLEQVKALLDGLSGHSGGNLATWGENGPCPGIDITDNAGTRDLMDEP